MIYEGSSLAFGVFIFFVALALGVSLYLGSRVKSAAGYYAAHGEIHWFVNGIAFAGDYLSAASFLGTCGMIAFYGYDGFLYSIGYLAGWIVALFVVAEPLKRMGRFTFADALDRQFSSRGVRMAAAVSTLVISLFYLIPQMVGAGVLIKPLLGLPHYAGVLIVGFVVTFIVVTAGMVSTTWVQFIKGAMLIAFCTLLTVAILVRGLKTDPSREGAPYHRFAVRPAVEVLESPGVQALPEEAGWAGQPYVRVRRDGEDIVRVWRKIPADASGPAGLSETQTSRVANGVRLVNGRPQGKSAGEADFFPVGHVSRLPAGKTETGPLGPLEFLQTIRESEFTLWGTDTISEGDGSTTTVYYQKPTKGRDVLMPGLSPTFHGLRAAGFTWAKVDFLSLMLALFCGTASLPHILIRYYTVKDASAVRKSTVVGIASIGLFYVILLYLGLGAMTSGMLDPTDTNMTTPLLARSFGEFPFALISAIAFTTVLGTVSGLVIAASGAVAHDLVTSVGWSLTDYEKVRIGKLSAVAVGAVAMALGILCRDLNVSFLVGWAFNIAASANLPALVLLLFWKGTTRQGITASIAVGLCSSLAWILMSGDTYAKVYGWSPDSAVIPFSQPAIVTVPLALGVLVCVSLATRRPTDGVTGETAFSQ